jgi:hypothetical protein
MKMKTVVWDTMCCIGKMSQGLRLSSINPVGDSMLMEPYSASSQKLIAFIWLICSTPSWQFIPHE